MHCDKSELVQYLAKLLKDTEVQRELPSQLKRQAMQIVNRSQYSTAPRQDQNLCKSFKTQATTYASARQEMHTSSSRTKQTPIKIRVLVPSSKSNKSLSPYTPPKGQGSPRQSSPALSTKSYLKEQEAIRMVAIKQRELDNEKAYLQQKVAEVSSSLTQLKHLISEQRKTFEKNTKYSTKCSMSTDNALRNSRLVSKSLSDKQKKNLDCLQQQKCLSQQLNSISQQKQKVDKALAQQKDLVEMYRMVINELKTQLKSQTRQRNTVKSNMLVAANVLEKTKQKFQILYEKTRCLVGRVDQGMRGFFQS